MSTTYYPNPDRWLWPVNVDSTNDTVSVIEQDGTEGGTTITATLTHSDQLSNGATYYCFGTQSTVTGANDDDLKVVDSDHETIHVRGLYEEIAIKLRNESASSGNSLNYQITAIQPSGADHDNIGLRLTHDGTMDIQWNFGASNHIDPRFFGWSEDGTDNSGSSPSAGTTQDGPFSRWGVWYSQKSMSGLNGQSPGKRRIEEHRSFASSPRRRPRKLWQWTQRDIFRPMEWYVGVAGIHVWPDDRADKTDQQDIGGLAAGDSNNALWYMWDTARFGDDLVIIGHGDGNAELGSTIGFSDGGVDTKDSFETGVLDREWLSRWAPHEDLQFDHAHEKYDIRVPIAVNDPDDAATDGYRH